MRKGIIFALITALVSGFSVFINSFAVSDMPNAYFFTTAKNIAVAFLLLSLLILAGKAKEFKKLQKIEWAKLAYIGLIGGSIPFLLFFGGLSMSLEGAVSGALIHKTLFIWVALMSFIFLKEKLSLIQYFGMAVIFLGILMMGGGNKLILGPGEWMMIGATFFWSFEAVFVRKFLKKFDFQLAAFGRMFFGGIIMLGYLLYSGKAVAIYNLELASYGWLLVTALLLILYVNFYYGALKYEKASFVTSIMTVAFPITVFLRNIEEGVYVFSNHSYILVILLGAVFILLEQTKGKLFPLRNK